MTGAATAIEMGDPTVSWRGAREILGPAGRLTDAAARCGVVISVDDAGWLVALLDRIGLEPQNLTAIEAIEDAVDRHLADSLVGSAVPEIREARRIVDLGSGGGFPGLVIARMLPDASVTLVESERRKADWLVRAGADLPNVRVVADRTEALAREEREVWDLATARALATTPSLLELAAPLVRVGGSLVAWRGPSDAEPTSGDRSAGAEVGFAFDRVIEVEPFAGAERRLVVWRKTEATSGRFPRRPGRATKRPLA